MEPSWLIWARELQAIAQTGLTFTQDMYDRDRYAALRALAARIMAEHSATDHPRIETLFVEQYGYATPKVDVRAAVFRDDGRVLMVRELTDGRWSLPGGWADVNQPPSISVAREVREEASLEVTARKLAAVYDRSLHPHRPPRPFHVYKLFFLCDITGGTAAPGPETTEVGFFAEDELPEDISIGRVLPFQIKRMFEHHRAPALPTDFD